MSEWYFQMKKNKEACEILKEGIKKCHNTLGLKMRLIELLLTDKSYNEEHSEKISTLIDGLNNIL